MTNRAPAAGAALRIIDDAWAELRRSPGWGAPRLNECPAIADVSFEAAQQRATSGRALSARIAAVNSSELPHDLALTLRMAAVYANRWRMEEDWYWVAFDPLGVGQFGLFAPTAYCGGLMLGSLLTAMRSMELRGQADLDRYLAFVADITRLVRQFVQRTEGQAARGIYMPQVQLKQAVELLGALKRRAIEDLRPDERRLAGAGESSTSGAGAGVGLGSAAFLREVERRVQGSLAEAFDDFVAFLSSSSYAGKAPAMVGMSQYPEGRAIYEALVRESTTLDITPAEVHAIGLERIARIRSDMASARADAKFAGSDRDYREALDADPRWRAATAADVTKVFRTYIDRLRPRVAECFSRQPKATYDAEALPDAQAGSMSFGFYDPPKAGRPSGRYLYNARNLTQRGLFNLGTLNYHELVPGHHMHFALQVENEALHPLRANGFINAFNEGWAEYAATLAGEMGMYELPDERFGRCVMDAFLTSRLVVDTGMNALGWSLEQAREYMRENAFLSEQEVLTESVRYSCDIPAQSLAYKLGDVKFMSLRTEMAARLGPRFDIREFHDAILSEGALPLSLVESNVRKRTAALTAGGG